MTFAFQVPTTSRLHFTFKWRMRTSVVVVLDAGRPPWWPVSGEAYRIASVRLHPFARLLRDEGAATMQSWPSFLISR
jgi:hypothetical protein